MASFILAFKKTDHAEGGYAFVKGDAGGETYRGISRRWFAHWQGWEIIDKLPPSRKTLNAKIPEVDYLVDHLYEVEFWDKIHGGDIIDQSIAEVIYDFAVTSAPIDAIKAVQRALGGVVEDGIMGPHTLASLNHDITVGSGYNFLVDYCTTRMLHYAQEAKRDPSNRQFLRGWWSRVTTFV